MSPRAHLGWALVALLFAGVAIPLLVTLSGTPLDVPRNDAFAYSLVAEHLHESGSFHLIGFGRMMLIGHVLWGQPFLAIIDNREVAGNSAGVIASAIAIVAYFLLAMRFVTLRTATIVTLVFIVFQGVAVTVPTYMTEPTALALDALALLATVVALERRGRSAALLVVVAVMLCVASFSVREFAVALLVAIAGVVFLRRRELRVVAALASGVGLVACGALFMWHSRLPGLEPSHLALGVRKVGRPAPGFVTLGFGLLPLTLVTSLRLLLARGSRLPAATGAAAGAVMVLVALSRSIFIPDLRWTVLADDIYMRSGASGQGIAVGLRPDLLPTWAWLLLNGVAVIGSIALGAVTGEYVYRRFRRGADGRITRVRASVLLLELVTLAYLSIIAVFGIVGPLFNDRYVWPVVPIVAILAARVSVPSGAWEESSLGPRRMAPRGLTVGAFVVLALVAVTYTQDSAAYDGALWRAGQQFVASGAAAANVDAGLEWIGAHSAGVRNIDGHQGRPVTSEDPKYEGFWLPVARCFVVSNERLDPTRYSVVGTVHYRSRLWTTRHTLWRLQRRGIRGCVPAVG